MKSQELEELKHTLRREIIFGRLAPGERLVESELAATFGLGRHIVRSAFDELEKLGLILRRPNRGVTVTEYSPREIEELYEMRELLQREAVARIPMPVPRATIAALQDINDEFQKMRETDLLDDVVDANNRFHSLLFSLCGNQFLARAIEDYWEKTAGIHSYAIATLDSARKSHAEHQQMIEALVAQDRPRLADLCIQHMMPALNAYKLRHSSRSQATA